MKELSRWIYLLAALFPLAIIYAPMKDYYGETVSSLMFCGLVFFAVAFAMAFNRVAMDAKSDYGMIWWLSVLGYATIAIPGAAFLFMKYL